MAEREHGIMNEGETGLLKKGHWCPHSVVITQSPYVNAQKSVVCSFFLSDFHHLSELNSLCSAIKFNLALMQFFF